MILKHPPHRYTEVRTVGNEPYKVVAAWTDDLTVEYSNIFAHSKDADALCDRLRATCRGARRLLGLPTPLLEAP